MSSVTNGKVFFCRHLGRVAGGPVSWEIDRLGGDSGAFSGGQNGRRRHLSINWGRVSTLRRGHIVPWELGIERGNLNQCSAVQTSPLASIRPIVTTRASFDGRDVCCAGRRPACPSGVCAEEAVSRSPHGPNQAALSVSFTGGANETAFLPPRVRPAGGAGRLNSRKLSTVMSVSANNPPRLSPFRHSRVVRLACAQKR
jgi:hypothetical protein